MIGMDRLFAVIRTQGPHWKHGLLLEQQQDWTAHAMFMDALTEEGFVVLGGPLEGSTDFLLIFRAADADQIVERLADDPWSPEGLLVITRISLWTLRLGSM